MRSEEIDHFLTASKWPEAIRSPLAGDASARRYERVRSSDRRAILMDAPPASGESIAPFAFITQVLREHGYSAPEILARDKTNGFLLLEDLGDALFAQVCERDPRSETLLYSAAVDVLVDLHKKPINKEIPLYSTEVFLREAALLPDFYLNTQPKDLREEFLELVKAAMAKLDRSCSVLILRDYHAENLIWLPNRIGHQRVGLLDYQDALIGHPAYDLVSLLEDARRDTSAEMRREMIDRYVSATRSNPVTFARDYAILGAQRNMKIIGIFARLALRDKKPRYLDLIPRVWQHLQRDLVHPDLANLRDWVSKNVPYPDAESIKGIRGRM